MRTIFFIAILPVMFGCATNSGIVDLGANNYVYEKEDALAGNGNSLKVKMLKEAAEFCIKQGKQMAVLSSDAKSATPSSYAAAEVQFSCK